MSDRAFCRALPVDETPPAHGRLAAVLEARSDSTPTTFALLPVEERKVVTRRRRRPRPSGEPSGFPSPGLATTRSSAHDGNPHLKPKETRPGSAVARGEECSNGLDVIRACSQKSEQISEEFPSARGLPGLSCRDDFPENTERVAAMTTNEIQIAMEEVQSRLKPELLAGLKERGRKKLTRVQQPTNSRMPAVSTTCISTEPVREDLTAAPHRKSERVRAYPSQFVSPISDSSRENPADAFPLGDVRSGAPTFASKAKLAKQVADVVSLEHIPEVDESEREKLQWTASLDQAESPSMLDEAVSKSMDCLGFIGKWRFDLQGSRLSDGEIASLPSNLGLHHHGTQPREAGYTLGDILILTRSSLYGQRVIALNMLAGIIRKYGMEIAGPLADSGGLRAILEGEEASASAVEVPWAVAPCPTKIISYSLAYVHFISAVLECCSQRQACGAAWPDALVYFASRFYSTLFFHRKIEPALSSVVHSSCDVRLLKIAYSSFYRDDAETAELALKAVHHLVEASHESVTRICNHAMSLQFLCAMGNARSARSRHEPAHSASHKLRLARLACLSCEILAECILLDGMSESWLRSNFSKGKLLRNVLAELQGEINWYVTGQSSLVGVVERECRYWYSVAGLRVFRALLSVRKEVESYAAVLRGLPMLIGAALSESGDPTLLVASDGRLQRAVDPTLSHRVANEAYLSLEAYAHCLFSIAAHGTDHIEAERSGESNASSASMSCAAVLSPGFAKEQLLMLFPIALESVNHFVGGSARGSWNTFANDDCHILSSRAAAGHFVATALAMTGGAQVFLSAEAISRVIDNARLASKQIGENPGPTTASLLCSLAQASARILPRALSSGDEALQLSNDMMKHLQSLLDGSKVLCSRKAAQKLAEGGNLPASLPSVSGTTEFPDLTLPLYRVVAANAAADWLGLAASIAPSTRVVQHALNLLPYVSEAQVAGDIVSRCILNPNVLCAIDSSLAISEAESIAAVLLPLTLDSVFSNALKPTSPAKENDDGDNDDGSTTMLQRAIGPCISSEMELLALWISASGKLAVGKKHGESTATQKPCMQTRETMRAIEALFGSGVVSGACVFRSVLLHYNLEGLLVSSNPFAVGLLKVSRSALAQPCLLLDISPTGSSAVSSDLQSLEGRVSHLGGLLVERGPAGSETQVAASVLLSLMLHSGVGELLRHSLWSTCVLECGGLSLFEHAELLGDISCYRQSGGPLMTHACASILQRDARVKNLAATRIMWNMVFDAIFEDKANTGGLSAVAPLLESSYGRTAMRKWLLDEQICGKPSVSQECRLLRLLNMSR